MTVQIVLASGNTHKQRELQVALRPLGVEVRVLDTPPDVEESASTFAGNALLKALGWFEACGQPSLADDSGLEVDALDGAPGVYSARYAGVDGAGADAANNRKLLANLSDVDARARTARFRCALVLVAPPGPVADVLRGDLPPGVERVECPGDLVGVCCLGATEGTILFEGRGEGGFGYDPLFSSTALGQTFAEASSEAKARVSHRGEAVRHLVKALQPLG